MLGARRSGVAAEWVTEKGDFGRWIADGLLKWVG
jgi:hypothetical protein